MQIFCGVTTMLFSLFLAGCRLLGYGKVRNATASFARPAACLAGSHIQSLFGGYGAQAAA
jgi:hypothetical protein